MVIFISGTGIHETGHKVISELKAGSDDPPLITNLLMPVN